VNRDRMEFREATPQQQQRAIARVATIRSSADGPWMPVRRHWQKRTQQAMDGSRYARPSSWANGKDQRLAALGSAITHDDARESFASCG